MAEEFGLDAVLFPDSQNLVPEVWGQLMLAARNTKRVGLGPGVTNSVTRDPAVTASAALALQVESEGRAIVGIGRADSAVQRIGRREDPVASFEGYLASLQGYLRDEDVERDGFASRLEWLARAKALWRTAVHGERPTANVMLTTTVLASDGGRSRCSSSADQSDSRWDIPKLYRGVVALSDLELHPELYCRDTADGRSFLEPAYELFKARRHVGSKFRNAAL